MLNSNNPLLSTNRGMRRTLRFAIPDLESVPSSCVYPSRRILSGAPTIRPAPTCGAHVGSADRIAAGLRFSGQTVVFVLFVLHI
jgi:hypothetical protein